MDLLLDNEDQIEARITEEMVVYRYKLIIFRLKFSSSYSAYIYREFIPVTGMSHMKTITPSKKIEDIIYRFYDYLSNIVEEGEDYDNNI